jgi:hypothetical protein
MEKFGGKHRLRTKFAKATNQVDIILIYNKIGIGLETATLQVPHYFTLRYLSIALRMYLLRGISPRLLSIFCNKDIGKVIPSFSVISGFFLTVLTILVDYI